MKWVRIIFFIGSIILSFMIVYAIINNMISYKYEIEEPPSGKIDIGLAEVYLKSQTTWLWCFFSYIAINIIILYPMLKKKK